jgi:hypothetical protein
MVKTGVVDPETRKDKKIEEIFCFFQEKSFSKRADGSFRSLESNKKTVFRIQIRRTCVFGPPGSAGMR